jgi:hypothetical protein
MKKKALFVIVVGAVTLTLVSEASASCYPGRASGGSVTQAYGIRIPSFSLGDVAANVLEYDPYMSGLSSNGVAGATSAWVSIDNNNTPSQYGQIGWIKYSDNSRHSFLEYTDSGAGVHDMIWAPSPPGNTTPYEVWWDAGNQRLDYFANGLLYYQGIRYFTMRRATVAGEIHDNSDQMPGGYVGHEQFTNATVADLSNTVYNFDGTPGLNPSFTTFAGSSKPSSTEIDVWDTACAS